MGMRELRTTLRAVVQRVEEGAPVVILKDGQPLAVMLQHEEAERWRKIEDSLAALHALNVYPEALNDPSELADLATLQPPDGLADACAAFATLRDEVPSGRDGGSSIGQADGPER